MNERIKQLAEQAAISCGYFIGPRLYMTHEEEMEKFAKLIVEEMYDFMCKSTDNDGAWPSSKEVKQHFGVDE